PGRDDTEFAQMTAQGVNRLGSLLDEKIPCLQEHHARLAIDCFDRYETHGWPRYRLADRFSVDRIGLAAFDIRLHVGRRDQSHVVAEHGELASSAPHHRLQDPHGSAEAYQRI